MSERSTRPKSRRDASEVSDALLVAAASLCAAWLGSASAANAAMAQTGNANVEFHASGPGGMKIVGTGSALRLDTAGPELKVSVPLATVGTGIGLRDKHMHEKYLEVGKYPTAELTVPRAALSLPGAGDARGSLRLHGVTKEVSFHYDAAKRGEALEVRATTRINMKDFGIEVPNYLGVTVKPDVDISVGFGAKE